MRALVLLALVLIALRVPVRADEVATTQSVIRSQEQAFSRDDPRGGLFPCGNRHPRAYSPTPKAS
jgi:hypothetical protein